ncbi:hypothetical protein [Chitinophaga silvisoli]|uniref:Uncharacterized protein n=1 Tax=Chitinophaga silvisoli TaxID=2291814 RepID=A0A3E1PA29_9BACT|nr:hypothetical protein [Chitinophaga silvisoli]RFM37046.1 hypothetical protein DXN04_05985 [Chitinophaga silvisoli]
MKQMNSEIFAFSLDLGAKYPDAIEYMAQNLNIDTIEKDIKELLDYVFYHESAPLESTRKDEILFTMICLLNVSKQIIATKGIFCFDDEAEMEKSADDQLDTNVEGNILQQVHTLLVCCSLYFRKNLIERCKWTIPVYYRKMISFTNENRMMIQLLTEDEKGPIIYGLDTIANCLKGFSDELKKNNNIHH